MESRDDLNTVLGWIMRLFGSLAVVAFIGGRLHAMYRATQRRVESFLSSMFAR